MARSTPDNINNSVSQTSTTDETTALASPKISYHALLYPHANFTVNELIKSSPEAKEPINYA